MAKTAFTFVADETPETTQENAAMTKAPVVAPVAPASAFALTDAVPLPGNARDGSRYPWATMQPGQSFFVPAGKLNTFNTSCNKAGKTHAPAKFICRKVTEGGIEGVRVWRSA